MPKMRDSGIEWIGKIPKEWNVIKIGQLFSIRNERNYLPEDKVQLLSLYTGIGVFPQGEHTTASGNHAKTVEGYKIVKKNDIVVNIILAWMGAIGVSNYDGVTSPAYDVYKPDLCKVIPRYFHYVFRTSGIAGECYKYGRGIMMMRWRTYSQEFKQIKVPFPNIEQQKIIADYLDFKCNEIEELISDVQLEIDILEEYKQAEIVEKVTKGLNPNVERKDSGIEWIGMLPKHWDLKRGKYVLRYMHKPVREDDEVITCFRDGEVTLRINRREEGFTFSDKEIGYQGVDVGDLVVHGMDGFAGSIGISDSRGKASPVLNVLNSDQNKKYLMYFLRSMAYNNVFLAMTTGIRVRSCDLGWNKLAELSYPIPPIDEQNQIVLYIDDIIKKTDEVIKQKKKQLDILDELKKTIIYEYVTGKKEVKYNDF